MYGKKMGANKRMSKQRMIPMPIGVAKKGMSKVKRTMPLPTEMTKNIIRTLQPIEVKRPKRMQANAGQARAKMAGMKAALYNKKP